MNWYRSVVTGRGRKAAPAARKAGCAVMGNRGRRAGIVQDSAGQATLEWAMLLAVFVLPMIYVLNLLLSVLAEHFARVSFLETLPFP
jgi:hypothetical protein